MWCQKINKWFKTFHFATCILCSTTTNHHILSYESKFLFNFFFVAFRRNTKSNNSKEIKNELQFCPFLLQKKKKGNTPSYIYTQLTYIQTYKVNKWYLYFIYCISYKKGLLVYNSVFEAVTLCFCWLNFFNYI